MRRNNGKESVKEQDRKLRKVSNDGGFRGEFPLKRYLERDPKREKITEKPSKNPRKRNTCFGSLIEYKYIENR